MELTVKEIEAAKPRENDYKLYDEKGLYLLVTSKGQKGWRFKYRLDGKEKLLSLGTLEAVSLADVRETRDDYRKLVRRGIDPSTVRKAARVVAPAVAASPTLSSTTTAWIHYHRANKAAGLTALAASITPEMLTKLDTLRDGMQWSDDYADLVDKRLQRHITKKNGNGDLLVDDIDSSMVAAMLASLKPDIQHRIKNDLYRMFSFAKILGWRTKPENPAGDLKEVMKKRDKRRNFAAIIDPLEFGGFLRAIECYDGIVSVQYYLRLAPLLFQRPTELRLASWNEFDLDKKMLWSIPASRMKTKASDQDHLVPLSRQAVEILKELREITRLRDDSLLFPGERRLGKDERPISDNTINPAIATLGYKNRQTTHGFRACARTMLDEVIGIPIEHIDRQLDHVTKDPNGTAYDRTKYIEQRTIMMQTWADYLDVLKAALPAAA